MLEWQKLLNAKRIRLLYEKVDSHRSPDDLRSEFQRDYDRSLFSTPVRRLQDKAQVFPLEPHDSVRTRLTHSLEVSNVARGLASSITRWLGDTGQLADRDDKPLIQQRKDSIELIAATCGLIHDLGNPPFGHSGEDAIRQWFRDRPADFFAEFDTFPTPQLKAQLRQDFLNFEGNAQTLRIVSRLQVLADFYGLNLTCGTMSAACKYIATSSEANREAGPHEKKKPGFFTSEHDLIDMIRCETGTQGVRNPITYLVEAADDIVYSTVDIEDGVKKGAVRWDVVLERLKKEPGSDDPILKEILRRTEDYLGRAKPPLEGRDAEEATSQIFRTFAINEVVPAVVQAFKDNYPAIMAGEFRDELIAKSQALRLIKACKKIARECIFRVDQDILEREIAGRKVIHDLMDYFWEGVKGYCPTDQDSNDFPSKIRSLISTNYRRVFVWSWENLKLPKSYLRMQLVTDYVCGMTDSFASRLHRKLTNG
jgi:dGTPase